MVCDKPQCLTTILYTRQHPGAVYQILRKDCNLWYIKGTKHIFEI